MHKNLSPTMLIHRWIQFQERSRCCMSGTVNLAAIFAGSILICLPALSQTEEYRSEVSAQLLGAYVHGTTQNGIGQTSSDSGGILATYRFFFTRHQGLEANPPYSRSTTRY